MATRLTVSWLLPTYGPRDGKPGSNLSPVGANRSRMSFFTSLPCHVVWAYSIFLERSTVLHSYPPRLTPPLPYSSVSVELFVPWNPSRTPMWAEDRASGSWVDIDSLAFVMCRPGAVIRGGIFAPDVLGPEDRKVGSVCLTIYRRCAGTLRSAEHSQFAVYSARSGQWCCVVVGHRLHSGC